MFVKSNEKIINIELTHIAEGIIDNYTYLKIKNTVILDKKENGWKSISFDYKREENIMKEKKDLVDTITLLKFVSKEILNMLVYKDEAGKPLEIGKIYNIETCEPAIFIKVKFLGWEKESDDTDSYEAVFKPLENIKVDYSEMYFIKPVEVKK